MVSVARERYGRLDILVNNVGILGFGSAPDVMEEEWDKVLNVNLKSMMLASKFAIPEMIRIRGGGGSIINISSLAAFRGLCQTVYVTPGRPPEPSGGVVSLGALVSLADRAEGRRP